MLGERAAGTPTIARADGPKRRLERVSLADKSFKEDWLQKLIFDAPSILPIDSIEPALGDIVAVAREVPCGHGFIDNLYITPTGGLVLVEAKLWRNPQARREVVAQALDYVAALTTMGYEAFEQSCRKGTGMQAKSLHALVAARGDALEEPAFIDAVSRNLALGRMLVLLVGDGIRTETETLANMLESHAGAHFTLGLIELGIWRDPAGQDLVVMPTTIARTVMLTRGIVTIQEGQPKVSAAVPATHRQAATISSELYYEELDRRLPGAAADLKAFVAKLEPLGVYADLKASLNLKADLPGLGRPVNFGYIDKQGKLWTNPVSSNLPEQVWRPYLETLAAMIGGHVIDEPNNCFVAISGRSAPRISDLLPAHLDAWVAAVEAAIRQVREVYPD